MENLSEKILKELEQLIPDEFKKFKWHLKGDNEIPGSRLNEAKEPDTVDLMVQKYGGIGALEVTLRLLEKISRNDLVQNLQNSSSGLKAHPKRLSGDGKLEHHGEDSLTLADNPERFWRCVSAVLAVCLGVCVSYIIYLDKHYVGAQAEEGNLKQAKLMVVQQFAVDVTLDPDTAHPDLILSDDGKQVYDSDVKKKLPNNPERFNHTVSILGKQGFIKGKFYFEVQVKGKTAWSLGVAKQSINRKGQITLDPKKGSWTMWLRNGDEYQANDRPYVPLSLKSPPEKIGVFVDYEEGLLSFYDVDTADLLYSFTGCSFTEKLYPYFSPSINDEGKNSAPLIISPVNLRD